ncbi:MAG: hypothetical protein AAF936_09905 [Pseudomonadota bacterium]
MAGAIGGLGIISGATGIISLFIDGDNLKLVAATLTVLTFYLFVMYSIRLQTRSLEKIAELQSVVRKELDDNENILANISKSLRQLNFDSDLEQIIQRVASSYSVISTDSDARIATYAKKAMEQLQDTLEKREYEIDFDSVTEYPKPFYEETRSSIVSTNVGAYRAGFQKGIMNIGGYQDLISLNREAGQRGVKIRRIFIAKKDEISDELLDLIAKYQELENVEIAYIEREKAERIAQQLGGPIARLEDFTVFDGGRPGVYYSGRLKDLGANRMRVIITSNPSINTPLIKQFEALWDYTDDIPSRA